MDQHLTLLKNCEDQLEASLADAHQEEKDLLQRQIAELQTQIANPEKSLAEARKRISDLEALLDREANHIGGDRIAEAKAALEEGDYSLADDIFAEIESRNELAVQETARAAYGRGEVAEAEVRWQDAARRYADAARLTPGFDTLFKAREYAWRAGHLDAAHRCGTDLVAFARKEGTQEQIATALNEHAITLQAQGRVAEAEALYREALEIDRKTIGEAHPDYAIRLNNLAGVVASQEQFAEAEALYWQALEITRDALGEVHPSYAIRLVNLGSLLVKSDRVEEGREMLERALAIFRAALPPDHPHIASTQHYLDALTAP